MTDKKRKERIDSIQSKLEPLNQERIFLETNLYFVKDRYTKEFKDDDKKKIGELSKKINDLYVKINPLFSDLRNSQCKYVIEYKGELTNPEAQTKYWKTESEIFHMRNCCDIDTWHNGWNNYIQDICVNDLIKEIHNVIYKLRYTKFHILNIKKL